MEDLTFTEWLSVNKDPNNILAPPMDCSTAMGFLVDYLLDPGWCVQYSCGPEQANTEIVSALLQKYSKKYRKELKK